MDKQSVEYSEVLFSLKKEGNSHTCYNMDKPWRHYAKWNKQVTERQITHDCTNKRYLEYSKSQRQKAEWWLPGAGKRGKWRVIEVFFGGRVNAW